MNKIQIVHLLLVIFERILALPISSSSKSTNNNCGSMLPVISSLRDPNLKSSAQNAHQLVTLPPTPSSEPKQSTQASFFQIITSWWHSKTQAEKDAHDKFWETIGVVIVILVGACIFLTCYGCFSERSYRKKIRKHRNLSLISRNLMGEEEEAGMTHPLNPQTARQNLCNFDSKSRNSENIQTQSTANTLSSSNRDLNIKESL